LGLFINLLVKYLLYLNSRGNDKHFVDSMDGAVYKNHNRSCLSKFKYLCVNYYREKCIILNREKNCY
jgi:hypothetical protein